MILKRPHSEILITSGVVICMLCCSGPRFAGSDLGHRSTHHSSSHAVAAFHIQNRGRWAQMLAQGQFSSSKKKRGMLAKDVSSWPIFLTKKI